MGKAIRGRTSKAVHLRGAQGEELLLQRGREAEPEAGPGEPEGKQGLQADRPGVPGRLPDGRQNLDDLDAVALIPR